MLTAGFVIFDSLVLETLVVSIIYILDCTLYVHVLNNLRLGS